jgi:RNA polymerase sigma-70 factor (ECF subfamily)
MSKCLSKSKIKFADGTQILLKDFFSSFYAELTFFAGKFVPDSAVCEDIIQDIFVSFCEKNSSFMSLKALKAYFYTSIRNSCLDYLKHAKVEKRYLQASMYLCEDNEFFFDQVLKNEAYSIIYSEINKLPEMGKKILLLSLKENSNDEIAGKLNIAVNTVRTHKARAYKVLRKKLGSVVSLFLL